MRRLHEAIQKLEEMSADKIEKLVQLAIRGATMGEKKAARRALEKTPGAQRRWEMSYTNSPSVQKGMVSWHEVKPSAPIVNDPRFESKASILKYYKEYAKGAQARDPEGDYGIEGQSFVPFLIVKVDGKVMMLKLGDEAEPAAR